MTVKKEVVFIPLLGSDNQPKAGGQYLVVRKSRYGGTDTEIAKYMSCYFDDLEQVYRGFARFNGSDAERDQMEVHGLNSSKFTLMNDVLGWAELPQVQAEELRMITTFCGRCEFNQSYSELSNSIPEYCPDCGEEKEFSMILPD